MHQTYAAGVQADCMFCWCARSWCCSKSAIMRFVMMQRRGMPVGRPESSACASGWRNMCQSRWVWHRRWGGRRAGKVEWGRKVAMAQGWTDWVWEPTHPSIDLLQLLEFAPGQEDKCPRGLPPAAKIILHVAEEVVLVALHWHRGI